MEDQDAEFQCFECGAEVQADTKICPKCGASLEELFEEDNFEEIPVTSRPADLSTILSLLDENKIEYSINDNAMENVWGPSFTQVPKLLVRKEQVDAVKEIITVLKKQDQPDVKTLGEPVRFKSSPRKALNEKNIVLA